MRRLLLVAAVWQAGVRAVVAQCGGEERWAVKMGADPAAAGIGLTPVVTSLHDLVTIPRPTIPSDEVTRTAAEQIVRVVDGHLVKFKHETGKTGDSDYHLVISDATLLYSSGAVGSTASPHSVIAEIPDPACVGGRNGTVTTASAFAAQLTAVQAKFQAQFTHITSDWNDAAGIPVRLTGVVFFDKPHRQVGRALNGLELHPLLDIEFNPSAAPPPPPLPGVIPPASVVTLALLNPDFEAGNAGWTSTADVITTNPNKAAHGGTGKAWLGGYGTAHTDRLSQEVALPASAHAISLTFFLHIDTEEANTSALDKLTVRVRNANGTFLKTLAVYSNLQAGAGFTLKSLDLTQFQGKTIRIELEGKEDNGSITSFVVDDFAVVVEP